MAGLHTNRGAKRAREARERLGLDPAAPLACLLTVVEERAGRPVVVAELPGDVAGACWRHGDFALLLVNGAQWRPRQRFTLAHELGHAWCAHDGTLAVDSPATLGGHTTDPREVQANAFAAELLVPRAGLEACVDGEPVLDEVVVLAAHFGVSAIVVVFKLRQHGLCSPRRAARLEAEIEEGLHHEAFGRLGLADVDDRLGGLEHLPYLSPGLEGTALGAQLRGDLPLDPALADLLGLQGPSGRRDSGPPSAPR